jgi:hypothetical protein
MGRSRGREGEGEGDTVKRIIFTSSAQLVKVLNMHKQEPGFDSQKTLHLKKNSA